MKNYILLILIFCIFSPLYAQEKTDIEKLRHKEYSPKDIRQNPESLLKDLHTVLSSRYDSTELQFVMTILESSLPVMLSRTAITPPKDSEKITIPMLEDYLENFKNSGEYQQAYKNFVVYTQLQQRIASLDNWPKDRILLEKLGLAPAEIEKIKLIVQAYPNRPYPEILSIFLEQQKSTVKETGQEKTVDPDMHPMAGSLSAYNNLKKAQELALQQQKPLLLYFSSYGSLSATALHSFFFQIPGIVQYIKDHYILAALYIDNRDPLPAKECVYSEILGRNRKYAGDLHLEFMIQNFKTKEAPLFVIYSPDGKVIRQFIPEEDAAKCLEFLSVD